MNTIWKYEIPVQDRVTLAMPKGSLSLGAVKWEPSLAGDGPIGGYIYAWFAVELYLLPGSIDDSRFTIYD